VSREWFVIFDQRETWNFVFYTDSLLTVACSYYLAPVYVGFLAVILSVM
jgi:hypothetical protein